MINVYERFGEWKDISMGEFRRGTNLAKYVVCGDEKKCKMYGECCQQVKEKRTCLKKYRHILSWHCATKEKKIVEKNRLKQNT